MNLKGLELFFIAKDKKIILTKNLLTENIKKAVSQKYSRPGQLLIKVVIIFSVFFILSNFLTILSFKFSLIGLGLNILKAKSLSNFYLNILPEKANHTLILNGGYKSDFESKFIVEGSNRNLEEGVSINLYNHLIVEKNKEELALLKKLTKTIKGLNKNSNLLEPNEFVVKNKLSLKDLYISNFNLFSKIYLIPELSSLNLEALSYQQILKEINLNSLTHPLLNKEDLEFLSNKNFNFNGTAISKNDILKIYNRDKLKPFYYEFDQFKFSELKSSINNNKFFKIYEKEVATSDLYKLQLTWEKNKLAFNYIYNIELNENQYSHYFKISHYFPSLQNLVELDNEYTRNNMTGPISSYLQTRDFGLFINQGNLAISRFKIPSLFDHSLPESLKYVRYNSSWLFECNLNENSWQYNNNSFELEYLNKQGYVINILLDQNLIQKLGLKEYLTKVLYPAITNINSPFLNFLGKDSLFNSLDDSKALLLRESFLELFIQDIFELPNWQSIPGFRFSDLIKSLLTEFENKVPSLLIITLMEGIISDDSLDFLISFNKDNLSFRNYLTERGFFFFNNKLFFVFEDLNSNINKISIKEIILTPEILENISKLNKLLLEEKILERGLDVENIEYLNKLYNKEKEITLLKIKLQKEMLNLNLKSQLSLLEIELFKKIFKIKDY